MTAFTRVALVGLRATGKTTSDGPWRSAWGGRFRTPTTCWRRGVGCSAGDYLLREGEAGFRRVEEEVCLAVLGRREPAVVSLGGGAIPVGGSAARALRG